MTHRLVTGLLFFLVAGFEIQFSAAQEDDLAPKDRPNILWLSCEDISAHLGCYGDKLATTPNLDLFAKRGVLYENAFATAGVCAPCRSAIITGMYQTSIGTQHMRCSARLPKEVFPFTKLLRDAGYYCTNRSKQDYQFKTPKGTWDESSGKAHWKNRPDPKQPFFSVFNYVGCHESGIASESKYKTVTKGLKKHSREEVAATLPPYYPNTKVTRDDWGRYYDVITAMDVWFGKHLQDLRDAGLADNTIVIFWSDHGVGLPRAKRWLYDSGMKVPFIVYVPPKYRHSKSPAHGSPTKQLVSLIDLAPTTLELAGVAVPDHMQGQSFLGKEQTERDYVYGARDRMDERYDIIRAVRDQRYKYIRNYEPQKTFYQYMNTPEKGRTMQEIRKVKNPSPGVAKFLAARKPTEELYDVQNDPHEMNNLAESKEHQKVLMRLRKAHLRWVAETGDTGLFPEAMLRQLSKEKGSAYAILHSSDTTNRISKLRDIATIATSENPSEQRLLKNLTNDDPAVRYWVAVGLGNRAQMGKSLSIHAIKGMRSLIDNDPFENVKIAAARTVGYAGNTEVANELLVKILDDGSQWARVHAANVLDEFDQLAKPVVADMKRNLAYRKEFVADGKYTVRVLNRALNELQGTNNQVK